MYAQDWNRQARGQTNVRIRRDNNADYYLNGRRVGGYLSEIKQEGRLYRYYIQET